MISQDTLTKTTTLINEIQGGINEPNVNNNEDITAMLVEDLTTYTNARITAPNNHIRLWEDMFRRRLSTLNISFPGLIPGHHNTTLNELVFKWRAESKALSVKVHFGQMRIGPNFAVANVNQPQRVQNLAGTLVLAATGAQLGQGHGWPIRVFWHKNIWVAQNNRGFAAHCNANIQPLRLIPITPEAADTNRLLEVEGQSNIPFMTYEPNVPHLLDPAPRRLPSLEMPITNGPNTWIIQNIVRNPGWT